MSAQVIMVQGTSSDAGKSLLVAGLCRYFTDQGKKVFPFKSQNMALNSYITPDGQEMSRAQVVQAEAARRQPDVRMNPILLKPVADAETQVILKGEHIASLSAFDYYAYKTQLIPIIKDLFYEISSENDLIIIEGAGSPAEINLNENDIVNMGMAEIADSPVILVADIDRGGVFASIYGTIHLVPEQSRHRIKGVIINKFRGDVALLQNGLDMIEKLTGVPVIGVIPYAQLAIDSEDSIALDYAQTKKDESKDIDIAVLVMNKLTNFSDFNSLSVYEDVSVRYVKKIDQIGQPDILILPGTENIEQNSQLFEEHKLADILQPLVKKQTKIIGICGGYHLLGETIIGKDQQTYRGLGLLPIHSTLLENSRVYTVATDQLKGYVTQVADIELLDDCESFLLSEEGVDGVQTKQVIGTSLNGLFENITWTRSLLNQIRKEKQLEPLADPSMSFADFKSNEYDKLAKHITTHINMEKIKQIME